MAGIFALTLWSMGALFLTQLGNIPTFQVLSVSLTVSFISAVLIAIYNNNWSKITSQPWQLWLIGVLGIYGNDLTFIAAFKYAPCEHVDLINYLWPILLVMFAVLFAKEKIKANYIVGSILGFLGIYVLLTGGNAFAFQKQYILGYVLALLDAVIWASFCILSRKFDQAPAEMVGMYCGVGAAISWFLHTGMESTVVATNFQWFIMLLMGVTTQGLAYALWDLGLKRGNFALLSTLSYGTPLVSIALLVLFGKAEPKLSLLFASILVVVGTAIASSRVLWSYICYPLTIFIKTIRLLRFVPV